MSNHKWFPRFARCINYCANLRTNFLNNERIIDRRRQKYEKLKITLTLFQNYYQSENLKAKHSVSLLCKSQIAVWFTVTNFRTNALKILKSIPIAKLKRKCLLRYLNLTLLINSVNYVTTKWHKIPISFLISTSWRLKGHCFCRGSLVLKPSFSVFLFFTYERHTRFIISSEDCPHLYSTIIIN